MKVNRISFLLSGIIFLILKSTHTSAQIIYNPPTNSITGNYTSGSSILCGYNMYLNNFQVSNTANVTARAGQSIKFGNGCSFNSSSGAIFYAYVDPNYYLNGCGNLSGNLVWDNYYTGDGSIVRYKKPLDYQLYPRKANNKGDVAFAATTNGVYNIIIRVWKTTFNNALSYLDYGVTVVNNHFSITIPIDAELSEYKFEYQLNMTGAWTTIADKVVCGDAYIISGQSNAETGDLSQTEVTNLNNTYGTTGSNIYSKYGRGYGGTYSYNGGWGVAHTNLGNSFHVGAWGLVIQNKIMETYGIPVCIINGAVGSSNISGHVPVNPTFSIFDHPFYNVTTNSLGYSAFLNSRVYHAGLENNISGIFWLEGDADGGHSQWEPYKPYQQQFEDLYEFWDIYMPNFKKVYVVQVPSWPQNENEMRVGSDQQRNLPLYFNKLAVMSANGIGYHRNDQPNECGRHKDSYLTNCGRHSNYWDQNNPNAFTIIGNEIHHRAEGYIELGNRLFRLVEVDNYGKTTNINDIYPPNILSATINGNQVSLHFDQSLSTTNSDNLNNILSAVKVYGSSTPYTLSNPSIDGNSFRFNVSPSTNVSHVSYLGFIPNQDCVPNSTPFNADFPCYLRNSKNVGALSFHNVSIGLPREMLSQNLITTTENNSFDIYPNPNNGVFTIRFESAAEKEIDVTDILGRKVKQLETKNLNLQMDLSDLKEGVYFVKVKSDAAEITKKVIIE